MKGTHICYNNGNILETVKDSDVVTKGVAHLGLDAVVLSLI